MIYFNFLSFIFFTVAYYSEKQPALIIFCFSNSTYWFFYHMTWNIFDTKREFVKEQQFFIDSHIILIILGLWYFEYFLKTPLQSIAHFPTLRMGLYFLIEKGAKPDQSFSLKFSQKLLQSFSRHFLQHSCGNCR